MRLAVISDIHANTDAFLAVLDDIDRLGVDELICLGDTIGYGPEPEECLNLIEKRAIPSLMGNHEMAVINPKSLKWFNPTARESIEKTKTILSSSSCRRLGSLPGFMVRNHMRFVHGFPPDSPIGYLFQVPEQGLMQAFSTLAERICFIGHTHVLRLISFDGKVLVTTRMKNAVYPLNPSHKYIINIGSVGQPREGGVSARYVILNTDDDTLDVRFVIYDSSRIAEKIIRLGFPPVHAERLRP
ncbi:MAG: metallophosphoesterase family protein [Desulfatirhabdiaceae bacterium]